MTQACPPGPHQARTRAFGGGRSRCSEYARQPSLPFCPKQRVGCAACLLLRLAAADVPQPRRHRRDSIEQPPPPRTNNRIARRWLSTRPIELAAPRSPPWYARSSDDCALCFPEAHTHVDPANGFRALLRRPTTRLDMAQHRRWSAAILSQRLLVVMRGRARPREPLSSRRRTRSRPLSSAAISAKLQNRRVLRMTIGGQSRRCSGRTLRRHERRESGGPAHAEPHLARAPRLQPSSRRSPRLVEERIWSQHPWCPAALHRRRLFAAAGVRASLSARPRRRRKQTGTDTTTSSPPPPPNTGTAPARSPLTGQGLALTSARTLNHAAILDINTAPCIAVPTPSPSSPALRCSPSSPA